LAQLRFQIIEVDRLGNEFRRAILGGSSTTIVIAVGVPLNSARRSS